MSKPLTKEQIAHIKELVRDMRSVLDAMDLSDRRMGALAEKLEKTNNDAYRKALRVERGLLLARDYCFGVLVDEWEEENYCASPLGRYLLRKYNVTW